MNFFKNNNNKIIMLKELSMRDIDYSQFVKFCAVSGWFQVDVIQFFFWMFYLSHFYDS